MKMKIKPIGNRILVKQSTSEEVTKSGIVLPDSAEKEKKAQGKIIALGNGERIKELGLKKGNIVIFGKYAGEDVELDREEYKILAVGGEAKGDVLAILE